MITEKQAFDQLEKYLILFDKCRSNKDKREPLAHGEVTLLGNVYGIIHCLGESFDSEKHKKLNKFVSDRYMSGSEMRGDSAKVVVEGEELYIDTELGDKSELDLEKEGIKGCKLINSKNYYNFNNN